MQMEMNMAGHYMDMNWDVLSQLPRKLGFVSEHQSLTSLQKFFSRSLFEKALFLSQGIF